MNKKVHHQQHYVNKHWHIYIRIFHWSLTGAILIMYFSDQIILLHADMGYIILAMIFLRVIFGLWGPNHIRFKQYPLGLKDVVNYFKGVLFWKQKEYSQHNPATAWISLFFFLVILLLIITGSFSLATIYFEGAWVETLLFIDNETALMIKDLHHDLTHVLLVLIFFHVSGVLLACIQHRKNVIRPMIFGKKSK